ncbi:MAG: small ribosomal subunit Rsm22 family protein [Planctomycetota bacterium]|jgi:ribosomal protein RSM22 (predicted rRNA methylase)
MGTYFSQKDLQTLRDLRATLLGMEERAPGEAATAYWADRRTLELYDRVFAARIGWKWEAVLDEVEARAGLPAPAAVLDWGTGTGVAARTVLRRLGPERRPTRVVLLDRDAGAREFAAEALRGEFPGLAVETTGELPSEAFDLVLASHVLDELEDPEVAPLLAAAAAADHVLWVEPGSKATSRRLSALRGALLADHHVIAPCVHRGDCGVLAEGHERDWCHLFARPPAEVHTTGEWSEVHRELRIDLRSLPYSFLALRRAAVEPPSGARLLGRPRFQKGRVLLDLCDAAGVETAPMLQRSDKALFKALKDTAGELVLMEREDGSTIRRANPE